MNDDLRSTLLTRLHRIAVTPALAMEHKDHEAIMSELAEFIDACGRHEYNITEIREVNAALIHALGRLPPDLQTRFDRLLHLRPKGAAHLIALEEQWRAIRLNERLQRNAEYVGLGDKGALQNATLDALRQAVCYSWSPMPVEAVAAAAEGLPEDAAVTPFALGDLGAPTAAGWWHFEEPIPIQTTRSPNDPVRALLWRREYRPDEVVTFFSCFVFDDAIQALTPSISWYWADQQPLHTLPLVSRRRYEFLAATGKVGTNPADLRTTVDATFWFSRFFLEAATWLRQRIVSTQTGQGIRQVSRHIQREHRLPHTPTVEIVYLRRREVTITRNPESAPRDWSCRWIVHGHTRNQWYPSKGIHAPLYIDSYIKGPDDKPLKTATRIYSVER